MIHKRVSLREKYIKEFIIYNWISSLAVVSINISFTVLFYMSTGYEIFDIILDILMITFDLNVMYAIRLMKLLNRYLKEWNNDLSVIIRQESDGYYTKMFEAFKDIIVAYGLYRKIFHALVRY